MIRATIFVSGRVQGVGFRYKTNEIAKSFAVVGTVENLGDGRVKIVAEGDFEEIDRFVAAVQSSSSGKIKSIDRYDCEPSREFVHFCITC